MPRLGSSKYIAFMVHDFARWNYYLLLRIVFPGYSWSRLDENHKSMHAQQLSIIEQTLRFKNVHLLILVTRSPFQPACVCWAGADLQGVWMRQRDGTRDKWSETSKPKKTWKGQDFFPFSICVHLFPFGSFTDLTLFTTLLILLVVPCFLPLVTFSLLKLASFRLLITCPWLYQCFSWSLSHLLRSKSVSHCMLRFQKVPVRSSKVDGNAMQCYAMPLHGGEVRCQEILAVVTSYFPIQAKVFCFPWVL